MSEENDSKTIQETIASPTEYDELLEDQDEIIETSTPELITPPPLTASPVDTKEDKKKLIAELQAKIKAIEEENAAKEAAKLATAETTTDGPEPDIDPTEVLAGIIDSPTMVTSTEPAMITSDSSDAKDEIQTSTEDPDLSDEMAFIDSNLITDTDDGVNNDETYIVPKPSDLKPTPQPTPPAIKGFKIDDEELYNHNREVNLNDPNTLVILPDGIDINRKDKKFNQIKNRYAYQVPISEIVTTTEEIPLVHKKPRPLSSRRPVIIDTDLGADDALALTMALNSDSLNVVAITVTRGNVKSIPGLAVNLDRILRAADKDPSDFKIYIGAERQMSDNFTPNVNRGFGSDALGGVPEEEPAAKSNREAYALFQRDSKKNVLIRAHEAMLDLADQYKNKLEIICLGPVTNLAKAYHKDNTINQKIKKVHINGGNFQAKYSKDLVQCKGTFST